jgi:uncharacterized protein (UPF0548 family)
VRTELSRPLVLRHAPSVPELEHFLALARRAELSYVERGSTRSNLPSGYDHDHNRVRLGAGHELFGRARRALEDWRHFPPAWSLVHPATRPAEDATVCVAFRVLGLWWLNAARIVYRLAPHDPARHAGFAYGTLPCHIERGEECFHVVWEQDDSVWYDLRAFSRPSWWPARLGKPLVRALQRRFVRDSQTALRAAVGTPAHSVRTGGTE